MYYIILNPSSNGARKERVLSKLKTQLQANGASYRVIRTKGTGHLKNTAREIQQVAEDADGIAKVVILGGDGTIGEFLSGITDFSRLRCGIIPTGTGNDMAKGLGLPDEDEIIKRIVDGRVRRRIDLGTLRYESRYEGAAHVKTDPSGIHAVFAVSCGIGFDAAICEEAENSALKKTLGKIGLGNLCYGAIALKHLLTVRDVPCTIRTKEGYVRTFDRILFASAMNLPYEGGGYPFAPDAVPDDGMLNITVFANMSLPKKVMAFPAARAGRHYAMREVTHFKTAGLTIRTGAPSWVHTDGEVDARSDEITIGILRRALAMMV